jgi:hypothetical protein
VPVGAVDAESDRTPADRVAVEKPVTPRPIVLQAKFGTMRSS